MGKSLLVIVDLLEVELIQGVSKVRAIYLHSSQTGHGRQDAAAPPHESGEVKLGIHHSEGVVGQLSLVHQVAHQSQHHINLPLHILYLNLRLVTLLSQLLDLGLEILAIFQQVPHTLPKLWDRNLTFHQILTLLSFDKS